MNNEKPHELEFCRIISTAVETIRDTPQMLLFLLRTGLITRLTVRRFMGILEYKRQIKRTMSKTKPKGQKTIALQFAAAKVGISERRLHEDLKKCGAWFDNSLFVQK